MAKMLPLVRKNTSQDRLTERTVLLTIGSVLHRYRAAQAISVECLNELGGSRVRSTDTGTLTPPYSSYWSLRASAFSSMLWKNSGTSPHGPL